MSTVILVVIILVVAGVAGVVLATQLKRRSPTQRLRAEFGPEYDRAVERHGDRAEAERDLLERKRRHRELDIRPLDGGARERYRDQWTRIQEGFVDDPASVVGQADTLVTTVAAERGYPEGDFDERIALLSVDHGHTVDHYRRAHEIGDRSGRSDASTEDLRQAMVHYRALLEDLLGGSPGDSDPEVRRHAENRQIAGERAEREPAEKDHAEDRRPEDRTTADLRADDRPADDTPADDRRRDQDPTRTKE
jgi:hypothetical protein